MSLELDSSNWNAILDALNTASKYAAVDLYDCTASAGSSGGGLYANKTFDPNRNYATGKEYIASLIFPSAAESIRPGDYPSNTSTFQYFTNLKEVSGDGIQTIGNLAFYHCTTLTSADFPKATNIGATRFTYGYVLTYDGYYAFGYCSALTSVNLPAATSIGEAAFYGCTALTSVNLPAAASIGEAAFYGCTALASVSLPAAASINRWAFRECPALASVSLPAAVSIGQNAFSGCALASVSLPAAASIGKAAFSGCTALTSVPAAASIGEAAFSGCTALTSVSLSAATTNIDYNPFTGCSNLTTITVASGNPNYSANDGMLLNKAGTTLIAFPSASGTITLPDITSIGGSAFSGCTTLASVDLPAVTVIGDSAFSGCTALEHLYLPEQPISLGSSVFSYTESKDYRWLYIHIPNSYSSYRLVWGHLRTGPGLNTDKFGLSHKGIEIQY